MTKMLEITHPFFTPGKLYRTKRDIWVRGNIIIEPNNVVMFLHSRQSKYAEDINIFNLYFLHLEEQVVWLAHSSRFPDYFERVGKK